MFREVDPETRLVHTEIYDPGTTGVPTPATPEALVTVSFTEAQGVTTVTTRIDFGSKEARDGAHRGRHTAVETGAIDAASSCTMRSA